MSSPWNKIEIPEAKNLQEIMEEELSETIQEKKGKKSKTIEREPSTSDDDFEMIQFCDIECEEDSDDIDWIDDSDEDESISSEHSNDEVESDDNENIEDKIYWDKYETVMKQFDPAPGVTARNIEDQPSRIINGVDTKTSKILQKMMDQRVFDKITRTIARGKQATILLATKGDDGKPGPVPPGRYVIKAFKRNTCEVQNCRNTKILPEKTDKTTYTMVQKEMEYLQRLRQADIPCPEVIWRDKNILVMSYIGKVHSAPTLKLARLSSIKAQIAFEHIMEYIIILFNRCGLVHTKLTEDNILWLDDRCYIISLSSAVETHENNALHLLYRTIQRICKFFGTFVPNLMSPQDCFIRVTGYDYCDRIELPELQKIIEARRYPH